MSGKREKAQKKRRPGCMLPLIALIAVLFWAPVELYFSNNVPRTEYAEARSVRLPEAFDGFRVLHLSDVHEKEFGTDNTALIKMAAGAAPDIIALTGDFIQSPAGLSFAQRLLPELVDIAPVYYVTGNHEWSYDWKMSREGGERLTPRLKKIIEDCGAVWLDSAWQTLERGGASVVIAGLCDPNGPADEPGAAQLMEELSGALENAPFTLLLSHRYDMPEEYALAGFDIVFAGHGHGGVVRLPFTDGLIGPDREWFPQGTSGVSVYGDTSVVVSRGLGDTYFPRFLNRPQVLLVTLKKG